MIRIDNLSKSFCRNKVLHELNLDIDAGDRVALVGSNGAGKTTLMRCLLGEYGYAGRIEIDGRNVGDNRARVLKRVGFVPQLPPPLKMPVGQLLQFAAGVCDSDAGAMQDVAAELGLPLDDIIHQAFSSLSGGQKQKLLISIALGRDLDVLVLDEPAANLDPKARRAFFRLLAERYSNTTMLVSSHRLSEVAALVNRVVELESGRVTVDDRVAASSDLNVIASCSLTLYRADEAFARAIQPWGFTDLMGGLEWQGEVAAADRLRFLGLLSRYSSILKNLRLDDEDMNAELQSNARTA
ncbi:MAG: ABC transporter ATP-binding protein [Gammaproteobacteria bacterium]|nr:ABC transporter ATP-binding protein [Gammaproteobacteria bacterium]